MNCEQISDHLADYVGCELDPRQRLAFESHLEQCAACSVEVSSLQETVVTLERLEAPPVPAASSRIGRFQPFAYAAMLIIGLGIGWSVKPAAPSPIVQPPAVNVQDTPADVHDGWGTAVAKGRKSTAFARNTVRLVRAMSGGGK